MTKCLSDLDLLDLARLDAMPSTRQLVAVSTLLHEARELVRDEACAKSLGVVVVSVDDDVIVDRAQVVLVIAALLRDAIHTVHRGGRVAVTAQEIEHELVFAVFDSGKPSAAQRRRFNALADEAAHTLGGRVWLAQPMDGNLSLFSVPLYRDEN